MLDLHADIELPAAPGLPGEIVVAIIFVIAVAATAIVLVRRLSPAADADQNAAQSPVAELDRLRSRLQSGQCSPRDAAYRLAMLLRAHFQVTELDPASPPAGIENPREWAQVVRQLSANRYAPDAPSTLPDDSFAHARSWLKQAIAATVER